MPIQTAEAATLLDKFYPADQSNIHGRLYASRVTSFMPTLVDFFRENQELVPTEFRNELHTLTEADIVNWQRVAMLRASGRYNNGTFTDEGSGSEFAKRSMDYCYSHLQSVGVSNDAAQKLSAAIVEADSEQKPTGLLSWVLKHALQLETLRDQKNKGVNLTKLPAWEQAKGKPQLAKKLQDLAISHYQLIQQQQGFACVSLLNENDELLYPTSTTSINKGGSQPGQTVVNGKKKIHDAGVNSTTCFHSTQQQLQAHYKSIPRHVQVAAPAVDLATTRRPPPQTTSPTTPTPKIAKQSSSMRTFLSKRGEAKKQAKDIWEKEVKPLLAQGKKVGLIYSANNNQALNLHQANKAKKAPADGIIGGAGQAVLFAELAKIINGPPNVADSVRILPIATSLGGGPNTPGNQVTQTEIDRDLEHIAAHKNAGWEIRGLGTPQGTYSIGGGISKGWNDVNNAQIVIGTNTISQGEYVENCLQSIAAGNQFVPLAQPSQTPATHRRDWSSLREASRTTPQSPGTFNPIESTMLPTLQNIETSLKVGKTLLVPSGIEHQKATALDTYLKQTDETLKNTAADLIAVYSVKQVLNQLNGNISIQMVSNIQAASTEKQHDRYAMKVKFATQTEAQAFCDKLFDEHGIHSYTFGKDTPKTAQNGSVFLTKDDLEKIAQTSKIILEPGSGKLAYETKASTFEQTKKRAITEVEDIENAERSSLRRK